MVECTKWNRIRDISACQNLVVWIKKLVINDRDSTIPVRSYLAPGRSCGTRSYILVRMLFVRLLGEPEQRKKTLRTLDEEPQLAATVTASVCKSWSYIHATYPHLQNILNE